MPEALVTQPSSDELGALALAEALEDLSSRLGEVLPGTTDQSVRQVMEDCLARLRRVSSGLRAMALVLDPAHAEEIAKHEGHLRSLVSAIGQSIRGIADANWDVANKMAEQVKELDNISKLPPGEELAERLRNTVLNVHQAARAMGENLGALATQVQSANEQITVLEQQLKEARERALYDALTRVSSRAALDERLAAAVRDGESGGPWCIMIADLDHFKEVNDQHGHLIGDALLYKIARVMEGTLKERAGGVFLARYGGEEFCIILAGAALAEASEVAEQIRGAIASAKWQPRTGAGAPVIRTTISIGVTQYRQGDTVASLIERTDRALYRAKKAGRNKVAVAETSAQP